MGTPPGDRSPSEVWDPTAQKVAQDVAKSLRLTKAKARAKAAGLSLTIRRSLYKHMTGPGHNYRPAPPPPISPLIETAAKAPDTQAEAPFVLELFLVLAGEVTQAFLRPENSAP